MFLPIILNIIFTIISSDNKRSSHYSSDPRIGINHDIDLQYLHLKMGDNPNFQIRDLEKIEELLQEMKSNNEMKSSLPAFLYSLKDKAKKLAIPVILQSERGFHLRTKYSRDEIIPIVEAFNTILDVGTEMAKYYQDAGLFEGIDQAPFSNHHLNSSESFHNTLKNISAEVLDPL